MNYIYQNVEYKTQEEINKMSYNEKFISCKCGKKPEFRWVESKLTVNEGKGLFYSISPFKGRNGEEVCHKCAPCVKCGKEVEDYRERLSKSEETNDNPSGKWSLAHCSIECFNGTEKPSLPKKAPEKFHLNANCDHCGKWSEIKVGNAYWGKSFCSGNCYELAFARLPTSQSDEIGAHCCVCGFRIFGQDGNYAENFKNGRDKKLHFSDRNFHARYCSETCFEKRGEKFGASCKYEDGSLKYNYGSTQLDNSPKPNPTSPNFQPITNSTDKSDNSVQSSRGSTDSPPTSNSQLEKSDHSFEIKLNPPADNPKNSSPSTNQGEANKKENENKQVLVFSLKDIKSISLVGNNLVIEFNQGQQRQTVVSEQVSNNQDLAKVKNYLQSTHRSRVSNQELASILGGQKVGANNPGSNSSSQPSQIPLIAAVSVVGIALIGGLSLLVVKLKKTSCSHKVKKS